MPCSAGRSQPTLPMIASSLTVVATARARIVPYLQTPDRPGRAIPSWCRRCRKTSQEVRRRSGCSSKGRAACWTSHAFVARCSSCSRPLSLTGRLRGQRRRRSSAMTWRRSSATLPAASPSAASPCVAGRDAAGGATSALRALERRKHETAVERDGARGAVAGPARPHLCDGAAHRGRQAAGHRHHARSAVADPTDGAIAALHARDLLRADHAHRPTIPASASISRRASNPYSRAAHEHRSFIRSQAGLASGGRGHRLRCAGGRAGLSRRQRDRGSPGASRGRGGGRRYPRRAAGPPRGSVQGRGRDRWRADRFAVPRRTDGDGRGGGAAAARRHAR